ncbi:MAG: ABC transporter ATP-binding protein [Xenococcaceae cyanobacterium MO_207.B15]|nr:ABC transporter ATP-binding protein [Xenococcaceae cyanobacterium MO_207.B15]
MTLSITEPQRPIQPEEKEVILSVEGVSKKFCRDLKRSLFYGVQDITTDLVGLKKSNTSLRPKEFWALDNVSFQLRKGEALGLVGKNGSGKSTLLRIIAGLIKPDTGIVRVKGRVAALIALGAGFNPILTGRENIYVNASVLGLSKKEIDEKIDEIIDFAEIGDFIDSPVQSYSSGMQVRLGFAVASTLKPDILILDEVLAVGDVNFRAKCWDRLSKMLENASVILVSHEIHTISRICDRCILLNKGSTAYEGDVNKALKLYLNNNKKNDGVGFLRLDSNVKNCLIRPQNTLLKSSQSFSFFLEIEMIDEMQISQTQLSIVDDFDNVQAQLCLKFPNATLSSGNNIFLVELGPLHLAEGNFFVSFIMSTSRGKKFLIYARRILEFSCSGELSYGISYCPPSKVSSLTSVEK